MARTSTPDLSKYDLRKADLTVDGIEKMVAERLDEIERILPAPADKVFRYQRSVANTGYKIMRNAGESMATTTNEWFDQAQAANQKIVGMMTDTARTYIPRSVRSEASNVVADTAEATSTAATKVKATAETKVAADLDSWTKDELYDRAQELDIAGRSAMTKDELIAALKSSAGK